MNHIVVTTINPPTEGVRKLARLPGWQVVVVGDRKTPEGWAADGAVALPLEHQWVHGPLAMAIPEDSYARKNLGYLYAIRRRSHVILETDDDNIPGPGFGRDLCEVRTFDIAPNGQGWVNVYSHFSRTAVWPRGLPLDKIRSSPRLARTELSRCPVQQFLADRDPDVDAIWRLAHPEPLYFDGASSIALGIGTWSPFNSQNTAWWPRAHAYLYLPSFVPFRLTDIWRSFVAQRCLAEDGLRVGFHGPNVIQERNAHSLLADFKDELPGYLNNAEIMDLLFSLDLHGRTPAERLVVCYRALVAAGIIPERELLLVDAWVEELDMSLAEELVAQKMWRADGLADERRHAYPLNANSVVLDLGGYRGDWTAEIVRRYDCTVEVFEPVPSYAAAITERFADDLKVTVRPFGLAPSTRCIACKVAADSTSAFTPGDEELEFRTALDWIDGNEDLVKINIEGGEYDLLEHLLQCDYVAGLRFLQIQFHHFIPDAAARANAIRRALTRTHNLDYSYPWIFDSWSRR